MKKTSESEFIEHPLEFAMGIEPGSTLVQKTKVELNTVETDILDEKDVENEKQLDSLIEDALGVFEMYKEQIEITDDSKKARMGEVALMYLELARKAVTDKMTLKGNKEKLLAKVNSKPQKTVNNLIVADRNEILKSLNKNADSE